MPSDAPHVEAADGVRVVFLGRLHPIKGLESLLDGFALALAEGLRGSLTIAGQGDARYTRSLRARISALGLDRHVSMIGWVDGDAKRALFSRADVLVVPSYRESFGIVVAEALAHGVPVIAARNTPWRCLEELGLGLWVDNDPASLAAALLRAQRMSLREMGRRGRAWVARELTTDLMAQRTLALYRRLTA